jgi:outer membrane protein OmpA-like peptidoglycan-associated protein
MSRLPKIRCRSLIALLWVGSLAAAAASSQTEYEDSKGNVVVLPLAELSFADRVVSFQVGKPAAKFAEYSNPELALGPPNYVPDSETASYTTLGCSGVLTLEFTDNALVDGPGPDLHIFEIGPDVEDQKVEISANGRDWLDLGQITGGTASVDIGELGGSEDTFNFVRLTDLRESCGNRWPGADVDAVAAVGGAIRMSLSSVVLFDFDKAALKPEAASELAAVVQRVEEFPGSRIIVEGHTDSVGSDSYNLDLSKRRAGAVQTHLATRLADDRYRIAGRGFGESRPKSTNDTDSGRETNRRVEILIIPPGR